MDILHLFVEFAKLHVVWLDVTTITFGDKAFAAPIKEKETLDAMYEFVDVWPRFVPIYIRTFNVYAQ